MTIMITDTIYAHLRDIHQAKISPLISEATEIKPEDTISDVIHKLSKNNSYDAFYYNGKSVLSTNIRALLTAKNIDQMKIESYLYSLPHLNPNDTIQKASNIIAHYRIREVPVIDKKQIIGVVSAKRILQLLSKKDNRWIKANLIYTHSPITISSNESLSTARKEMFNKRIDHLPVIRNNKINQVLTSFHVLSSIIPNERIGKKSIGAKTVHNLESPIGNIGSTRVPQCTPNDDLNKILDQMLKTDTTCCLVTLWDNLQGIITYRDILSLLATKLESEIPLYLVGMPEDQKNSELISAKFQNTLKRLSKTYNEIQEAKIVIRQHRMTGKKAGKYEVIVMIATSHHIPYIYKSSGFDLSQVIDELSQKLLRNLSKRNKQRSKPSIRKTSSLF